MSSHPLIHSILDQVRYNYNDLHLCLEKDASSINEINQNQEVPLQRVLEGEECSPDMIRLLIHHGADVNVEFQNGQTPLQMSLGRYRINQEGIIKELLHGGANKFTRQGRSLLCNALFCCNINIIRLLIEADCPMDSCGNHVSFVHCFINNPVCSMYSNADLLKLVIEKCRGLDLNILDWKGRSLLCYALRRFPEPEIINLMLDSGCLWRACKYHNSPWKCAMEPFDPEPHLTKRLVQMLIDVEAQPNLNDWQNEPLLHLALRYCSYEISAIQLMLDKEVVPVGIRTQDERNTLHAAVLNFDFFKPKIVEFLVKRGIDINAVDDKGNTPLHLSTDPFPNIFLSLEPEKFGNPNIIKALLKNGALVNVLNASGKTPLGLMVSYRSNPVILQLMLNAGARIGPGKWTLEALQCAMVEYTKLPHIHIRCCELLIRHSLIDDPSININPWIFEEHYGDIAKFINECRDELQRMESIYLNPHCTLHQLIDTFSQMDVGAEEYEPPNLNRLTDLLAHNQFPVYFDVICARFKREDMEPKLKDIVWYGIKTEIKSPETLVETNIFLNSDTISEIASYLSNEEVLKLIISSKILRVQ